LFLTEGARPDYARGPALGIQPQKPRGTLIRFGIDGSIPTAGKYLIIPPPWCFRKQLTLRATFRWNWFLDPSWRRI
jgi:hypothetical protein